MTIGVKRVDAAVERVKKWWSKLPEAKRSIAYKCADITGVTKLSERDTGVALRAAGWNMHQKSSREGGIAKSERLWFGPGYVPDFDVPSRPVGSVIATPNPKPAKPATAKEQSELDLAKEELRRVKQQLSIAGKEDLTAAYIKEKILKLVNTPVNPPDWLTAIPKKHSGLPGVPILQFSDFHWGEVVFPGQVGGKNEFNLAIAHQRLQTVTEGAIDLLSNHVVNPTYPGMVLILGGDMVTGDIHEELTATNEVEIMACVMDLVGALITSIKRLKKFIKKLFISCVTGNHGRNTHKIRNKGRNFTSFDWLIYSILELHFRDDPDIVFQIPDSPDALFSIYGYRYLLTHGDQFRGGDGLIGCLGPILRGDHKKRSRNSQIDMEYDCMVMGHWHQRIDLTRVIVNSSLKGYDEYAFNNNFGFEAPSQNLWLTHPTRGRTLSMPVFCDPVKENMQATEWVSWMKKQ